MALFEKPDLDKLKQKRNYSRLIDWANYTKDPGVSRRAKQILESDPYGLAEYLYETTEWTKKNSGHSGRRLPRRGVALLRQVSGMSVSIGQPMLRPLAESLSAYSKYGDPDIKTKLLYLAVVFDIFQRMGGIARETVKALTRDADSDVSKLARQCLKDFPEDVDEDEDDQWDDWDDDDEDADLDDEEDEDAG